MSRFQLETFKLLVMIDKVQSSPQTHDLVRKISDAKAFLPKGQIETPSYPKINLIHKCVSVIVWWERKRSHWLDQLQCYYIQSLNCPWYLVSFPKLLNRYIRKLTYICQSIKGSIVFDRKEHRTNTCKNVEYWVSICNKNEKGEVLNWNIINQYRWWCNTSSNLKVTNYMTLVERKKKCTSSIAPLEWRKWVSVIESIKHFSFPLASFTWR